MDGRLEKQRQGLFRVLAWSLETCRIASLDLMTETVPLEH
jgi:hypothetical protein